MANAYTFMKLAHKTVFTLKVVAALTLATQSLAANDGNDLEEINEPLAPQARIETLPKKTKPIKATPVKAEPTAAKKALSIGTIDTEVENDLTLITVRLSMQPTWKDLALEDHGTFLQIKLPETMIPNSGEFLDGNGPYLKKIATFQLAGDDGALRLFINQDAAKAKLATTAELLGERVVITIDHKKLEQLIQPKAELKNDQKALPATANEIIEKTTVKSDQPEPSLLVAKASEQKNIAAIATKDEQPGDSLAALNLKDKLIAAAGFCAAMLVLMLIAQWWRVKRTRSRGFRDAERMEPAAMRILSSLNISSKQRLSLIQVGSQQILIGLSPENISFLTHVESGTRPNTHQNASSSAQNPMRSQFGQALLQANPNAEIKLKSADPTAPRPARRPNEAATTPRVPPRPAARPQGEQTQQQTPRQGQLRVKISDDGIEDLATQNAGRNTVPADKPYDDITRIIRDRLKNLPSV